MMRTTAIKGMCFNEKYIGRNNVDGVFLIAVNRPVTPNLEYDSFSVPMRNGEYRLENRYEDMKVTVEIAITGKTYAERLGKARSLLNNWMNCKSKLVFTDHPNQFYEAKIFGSVSEKEEEGYLLLDIPFIASYCKQEVYSTDVEARLMSNHCTFFNEPPSLLINNITTAVTSAITNDGNLNANPIVKLNGSAELVTVRIKNRQFSFKNLVNQELIVDTEKMIAYTVSGSKKQSRLFDFTGLFVVVEPGVNEVEINGRALNLSVEINYRSTYLY